MRGEAWKDAKHAVAILNENLGTDEEPRYHALDTEVSHIDVTCQTPVGHGNVICFSVFAGPAVNFGETWGGEEIFVVGRFVR